jgi:ABC-type nitrate/sulfonate/bicarbonate transport system substrate-binding protein
MIASATPTISILPSAGVFHLPDRIALEEGLFEREGISAAVAGDWVRDVERFEPTPAGVVLDPVTDLMLTRFDSHGADTFNMCEWGVIHRAEISDAFRIGYLRPAVVTQAVLTFREDVQEPHDLADLPVAVSAFSGQHYTTLQLLEGALRRDQLNIVNARAEVALELAQQGELAATTVMEPFISLALKRGAHIVTSTFYRGGQVFVETVSEEARTAYLRAVNAAVDILVKDLPRYRSYITEDAHGAIEPEDLRPDYYRYTHAKELSRKRFDESYGWMSSWGFTSGASPYESIVAPVAASV